LGRWRKDFSQLLKAKGVNYVRHTEKHTAEPVFPEPSAFDVELATEKLYVTNHQVLTKSQHN